MKKKYYKENYYIETTSMTINMFVMLLVATIISIIPMLVNNSPAIHYTTLPLYITIVMLFGCVMYYRWRGLVVVLLTFAIYDFVLGLSIQAELPLSDVIRLLVVNTLSNLLQLFLILIFFLALKKLPIENKNRYAKGVFYLSKYNSFLLCSFAVYLVICLSLWERLATTCILFIFTVVILIATILKAIIERDAHLLFYTVFVAFLPSAIACSCSVVFNEIPQKDIFSYMITWILSNYILMQTFGYILFQIFYDKMAKVPLNDKCKKIDVSTVCYYLAVLIWNIIIISLFYTKRLGTNNNLVYLFPWMLGNVFLCANLIFSLHNDAANVLEKFKWFEQRVKVVEKNTASIITIISFLLPLGVNLLRKDLPDIILFLFIVNIFLACLSVGIIWVPANKLRFISLLKTLKTIFYLYTIMFLLVSVIMLMQLLQNGKG